MYSHANYEATHYILYIYMQTIQTISKTVPRDIQNSFKPASNNFQKMPNTLQRHFQIMLIALSKTVQTHVNTFWAPISNSWHQFDISFGHMFKTSPTHFRNYSNTFPNSCRAHVQLCFNIFQHISKTVSTQFEHISHMLTRCSNNCNMFNTAPTHFRLCSTYCQHMINTYAKPLPNHFRPMFKPCSNQFQHGSNKLQHFS